MDSPKSDDTLARISYLETKIENRTKEIEIMERKMAELLDEIARKKLVLNQTRQQKIALSSRLYGYRKAVQLSSRSEKSLLEHTKSLFEKQASTNENLDNEIQMAENIVEKARKEAEKTKAIIEVLNMNIPQFKEELLQLDFNQCMNNIEFNDGSVFDFNKGIIRALNNMEFWKDEYMQKQNLKKQLEKEIPKPPKMYIDKPRACTIKKNPIADMKGAKNFDVYFMNKSTRKAKNVISKYVKYINPEIQIAFDKANGSLERLNKIQGISKTIKLNKQKKVIPIKRMVPAVIKLKNKLNEVKQSIKSKTEEIQEYKMDIPEQYNSSPEALLKWRDQLLKRYNELNAQLKSQIQQEKMQLQDRKYIANRRINALNQEVSRQQSPMKSPPPPVQPRSPPSATRRSPNSRKSINRSSIHRRSINRQSIEKRSSISMKSPPKSP